MIARIIIEKSVYQKQASVFHELENNSLKLKIEPDVIVLEAKSGYLVSVLVLLGNLKIPYSISYNDMEKVPVADRSK